MNLGDKVPDFSLPAIDGKSYGPADCADAKALVVIQMCNHCPYVVGYIGRIVDAAARYGPQGVAFLGLNSNNAATHPGDSFEGMKKFAAETGMNFAYLHDESQAVAKSLGAERTPELYVFDGGRNLVYHGRVDDNFEQPDAVKERYLSDALEAVLAGNPVPTPETQAVGCTVKWK